MEKVIQQNITDVYKNDMVVYKISVNLRRITPDFRDGLKLVVRRILDVMSNDEKRAINNLVKSAKIVGSTMGKSHPHGDSSIYDAMKGKVNWFDVYMPLIYAPGNFGNFQGDKQAASRYTEVMLSEFCKEYVVGDILEIKQVTDWHTTYNDLDTEPEYLPSKVPLLLINGNYGIGVGMISQLPPHNINEVLDATLKLIDNPDSDIVIIPDQCMPCNIIDTDWKRICNTGNGNFKVRGIIEIKDYVGSTDPRDMNKKNKRIIVDKKYVGCQTLVIRSLPDLVSLNSIEEKIEGLMKEGITPQIIDSLPDSDEFQPNHILVLKKGSDPNYVRDMIYKKTDMQKTVSINFECMDGIKLERFSYKSYLQSWIEFAKITKFRLYCNRLEKVNTIIHEKEAYIKALESGDIDDIINNIRHRKDTDDNALIEYLIKKLNITDLQAKYIINAGIKNMSAGYLEKYKKISAELRLKKDYYMRMILDENLVINEIKDDIISCKAKYGFPRRSKLIKFINGEEDVPAGMFKIVITESNFIKKILPTDNPVTFRGDRPRFVVKGDNRENIILFNEQGKVFKYPISKIPLAQNNSMGYDLRMILKNNTSPVVNLFTEPTLLSLSKKKNKYFIVILTELNQIKKIEIEDIISAVQSGIIYTKLKNNDRVKEVTVVPEVLDIIIYSDRKALRCNMTDIPHYKKQTLGVFAMNTQDTIDGMSVIYPDATDIIVITEKGKCNRFDISGLPTAQRYTSGSSVIKLGVGDNIKNIFGVSASDSIKAITANGSEIYNISDIPYSSSASGGIKLIPLKGDNIIKLSIISNK